MQTNFTRFGRRFPIPPTIQIKHELREMIRAGSKPDADANPSAVPPLPVQTEPATGAGPRP